MGRGDLDPWRVILHHLFGIESREIPKTLDRTGLAVDWSLSEKEDYSAKTRLAAYRPRIVSAYEALSDDDKLRVAYIVTEALSEAVDLDRDLRNIGWKIEAGRLMPSTMEVRELFFPTGSQHDAYVEIRRVLQQARESVTVVDPYIDRSIFLLLGAYEMPVTSVRILTYKYPGDFALETTKFQAQHPKTRIETRITKEFHDRFVVIDDAAYWHLGASIKDAGAKAFMISQVEDQRNREALLFQFEESWGNARPIKNVTTEPSPSVRNDAAQQREFDALRRKILYVGVTNEIPAALRDLRGYLIESGLVERPEFRAFFDKWLASPFVSLGAPVPNLLSAEQIGKMGEELRALRV